MDDHSFWWFIGHSIFVSLSVLFFQKGMEWLKSHCLRCGHLKSDHYTTMIPSSYKCGKCTRH